MLELHDLVLNFYLFERSNNSIPFEYFRPLIYKSKKCQKVYNIILLLENINFYINNHRKCFLDSFEGVVEEVVNYNDLANSKKTLKLIIYHENRENYPYLLVCVTFIWIKIDIIQKTIVLRLKNLYPFQPTIF